LHMPSTPQVICSTDTRVTVRQMPRQVVLDAQPKTQGKAVAQLLIFDDEPDVLEILSELLCDEGFMVSTSTQLLDVGLVKQLSPSLIVLDLVFDGVELGIEFLRSIREDPELSLLPVIVCTGASYLFDAAEFGYPNTNLELIEKPFDLDEILAAVQRCLQPSSQMASD
jgi:DNA-binding response OmpR family regulator